jgi:Schlafen, AlbA_2
MRLTGLSQHTIEVIRKGMPVRRKTLERMKVVLGSWYIRLELKESLNRDSGWTVTQENPFQFTDRELLAKLKNTEDNFVERKTFGDDKDWLRTTVAFANSAPVGFPCILFIGVRDAGDFQGGDVNLDTLQRKLNGRLANAYPRIPYFVKTISEGEKEALAVIVSGSPSRPHFAGPPFVRRGSHTHEMSAEEYQEASAFQNSKAARILEYKDKVVSVVNVRPSDQYTTLWPSGVIVVYCDQHYVTLQQSPGGRRSSFPLEMVRLNFDDERNCLKIEILRG